MPRYIGAYRGGVRPSAPTTVYRTCALSLPCHSEPVTDVTGVGIRPPPFSCLRRGTFALGGKSTQKRRSNLRFENPLRAFTQHLSRWCSPRERCAVEISPKCCIVTASLSAAAFALKCRVVRFYIWCIGAGFYAVERSGTSALGVPRPPFLHYVSGGAEPRPYEPFRQQQFFQTSG